MFFSGWSLLINESLYIIVERTESDQHGLIEETKRFKQSCYYFNGLSTQQKDGVLSNVEHIGEAPSCQLLVRL